MARFTAYEPWHVTHYGKLDVFGQPEQIFEMPNALRIMEGDWLTVEIGFLPSRDERLPNLAFTYSGL